MKALTLIILAISATCLAEGPTKAERAESIASDICPMMLDYMIANAQLSHQKEIGRISGVANKQKLYDAGRAVAKLKPQLRQMCLEYTKITKKNFDFMASCPREVEKGQDIGEDGEYQ